jgi:hypothetical protein
MREIIFFNENFIVNILFLVIGTRIAKIIDVTWNLEKSDALKYS